MATVTGTAKLSLSFTQVVSAGVVSSISYPASETVNRTYANGTASGSIDQLYAKKLSLAATTTQVDLTSYTDVAGTAATNAARLRHFFVKNNEAALSGNSVTVGGNAVAAPSAPGCTPSNTGGSLAAGAYLVSITWKNAFGETTRSADTTATVASGTTGSIAVTIPTLATGATSANVYVSTVGGNNATEKRQNLVPQAAGTFTVTSIAAGDTPPTTNTCALNAFAGFLNAVGKVTLPPGASLEYRDPLSVGSVGAVTSSTSKVVLLDPGAATTSVDLVMANCSAAS